MIHPKLLNPQNIAIIGASENITKPGGMVVKNLLEHNFKGDIFAVNPKPIQIPGTKYIADVDSLPTVDLAIMAIPASMIIDATERLIANGTKAFIVFSAGFSEAGKEGIALEQRLTQMINDANGTLIGPNCIGIISEAYKGVFTTPIPEFDPHGCELISSSGATAVFIMESAIKTGLRFSNVFSIGNAAQTGVEEVLEYLDETFDKRKSSKVKLLYLEEIKKPFKFIKHATSLVQKGCKLAAIKSGYSEAGGRAASSHTGALATSDNVIRALFRKCGIVYCSSRDELVAVGSVFQCKELKGKNIAIITHAGGSAVMLTDALSSNGLNIPPFETDKTKTLLSRLNPGSSVANPIDFLATGTASQLGEIIDFCEKYEKVDGMVVVFGSSGLFNVKDVYELLDQRMKICQKPIYPVLPSLINAEKEIDEFLKKGRVSFPDEVNLGIALAHTFNSGKHDFEKAKLPEMDIVAVRSIINSANNGYLSSKDTHELLNAAGIAVAKQWILTEKSQLMKSQFRFHYPIVMKVLGPIHKTEVNGVRLNIINEESARLEFEELMKINGATGVLIQEMIPGEELYCGAVKQGDFGHVVLCGLGGVFLELINDTASALAPMSFAEVNSMIKSLKGYPLIKGYRNKPGLNEGKFIDIVMRVGALVHIAPEIAELDLNPLKAEQKEIIAVDARIRIEK